MAWLKSHIAVFLCVHGLTTSLLQTVANTAISMTKILWQIMQFLFQMVNSMNSTIMEKSGPNSVCHNCACNMYVTVLYSMLFCLPIACDPLPKYQNW